MHHKTQKRVAKGGPGQEGDGEGGGDDPRTYSVAFPAEVEPRTCPVEVRSGQAATWMSMQVHLWHRHIWYTVIILEGGNLPHPR